MKVGRRRKSPMVTNGLLSVYREQRRWFRSMDDTRRIDNLRGNGGVLLYDAQVSRQDIIAGLAALGLKSGDRVLVHSSLKSFGYVDGGPDTVIDALLDTVGAQGTVLFPTLSFRSVNEADPVFSVNETPSDSGFITEVARKRTQTLRSEHPLSSAAAIGADAQYLTSGHTDTPCGSTSPYGRLYELGGYTLFIGTDFDRNTMFHVAEEIAAPAYLRYKVLPNVKVTTAIGHTKQVTARRYDCYQTGINRYLIKMRHIYQQADVLRSGFIGEARCFLITTTDNVDLAVKMLRTNPDYILTPPED